MSAPITIRCTPGDDIWKAVAAENVNRLSEWLFAKETPPSVIIASERYEEMWQAILAEVARLQQQPGCQPGMRGTGDLSSDGRHMSCVVHVGHDDGTDSVYHVEAHDLSYQPGIKVSVHGPFTDSKDQFWSEQLTDRTGAVVINHTHYRIRPDEMAHNRDLAGHGGRLFRICWLADGSVTETRNLWYQGVIPPKWREQMPDDAEFVTAEQAEITTQDALNLYARAIEGL